MDKEITERLIKVRTYYGESVYAFAKRLDIPQPTLQRYESNERKIANKILITLNKKLNININWLLSGKGKMFTNLKCNSFLKKDNKDIEKNTALSGRRLVEIQEKNNFLDKEMAKILKISEKDYLKLVTGKIEFNIDILNNIKENFAIDIDWLLYGDN